MAKKKAAKKKAARKKARKKTVKIKEVVFTCVHECRASGNPHLACGEAVILRASGTDVYLWFVQKSPFQPDGQRIFIPEGQTVRLIVDDETEDGEYPYLLDCRTCKHVSRSNPKMIVP